MTKPTSYGDGSAYLPHFARIDADGRDGRCCDALAAARVGMHASLSVWSKSMNPIPSRSQLLSERVAPARLRFSAPVAAALLLSVAACGGGGDESSGTNGTNGTRITDQSAASVVSDAYRASNALYDSGNDAAQTSLDLKGVSRQRKTSMVDLALQRLEYLAGGVAPRGT